MLLVVLGPSSPDMGLEKIGPYCWEVKSPTVSVQGWFVEPDVDGFLNTTLKPPWFNIQDLGALHIHTMAGLVDMDMAGHFRCCCAGSPVLLESCFQ